MRRAPASLSSVSLSLVLAIALCAVVAVSLALRAPRDAAAQEATLTVEMGEQGNQYFFRPNELTVSAGTVRITFRNMGSRNHNFVIEDLNLRTPDIGRGQTHEATFNFTRPGTFQFVCDLPNHAARGMVGTLTVVAAQPATTPAAVTGAPAPTTPAATGAASPTAPAPAAGATATAPRAAPATPAPTPAPATTTRAVPSQLPLFISLAIHIPASIAWLGIVLYQAIIAAVPYLSPAQRGGLLARPRWLVVALIPIILATGIYQTIFNPFQTVTDFASLKALRHETTYGLALFWKHGFVLLSFALTLLVSFALAPRLVAFAEDTEKATPPRAPGMLAWANVAACAALLFCVTVMVFQLH